MVAKTKENGTYVQRLHALDITNGAERFGAPVVMQATVAPERAMVHLAACLPSMGFAKTNGLPCCSVTALYTWGLAATGTTCRSTGGCSATVQAHCSGLWRTASRPDEWGGGLWQANGGLAADAAGNIYYVSGNGPFDANTGGRNYGDSYVKLSPSGVVLDYFTPFDQDDISGNNFDLGAAGPMLLPDQPGGHPHMVVAAGKNNTLYLVDRDNMGHFHAGSDSQIVQSLINIFPFGTPEPGNYSAPSTSTARSTSAQSPTISRHST